MNKKIYRIILTFVLFATAQFSAFAQEPDKNSNQTQGWIRIQSDNGEFSVEMPKDVFYFYDKEGFIFDDGFGTPFQFAEMQMLCSSSENTVMSVEIYKVVSPKRHLKQLIEMQKYNGSKKDESKPGFTIKQFEQTKISDYRNNKDVAISHTIKFIASKTHLYVINVANRGAKSQTAELFLSSVQLNENQLNPTDTKQTVKISSFRAVTIEQIAEVAENQNQPDKNKIQQKDQVKNLTPLLILTKPQIGFTETARRNFVTGKIVLRITLEKNGSISKIVLLSGLPGGLNRNAFFAALRIKFIPEEKDGKPETVVKTIEYSFSIY